MVKNTYINIATRDIAKNKAFYQSIGFEHLASWSDSENNSFKINETTYLMVMNYEKFKTYSKSEVPNSFLHTESIISFELAHKKAVDDLLEIVKSNGGSEFSSATENDHMYYRSFRDPDGHHLEVFYFKK